MDDLLCVLATTPIEGPEAKWLAGAREYWLIQGSAGITGAVYSNFSEILNTEDRQQTFFRLIDAVERRSDLTPELVATLKLLVGLLKGERSTDASSPLDYMVPGAFPYHGITRDYP